MCDLEMPRYISIYHQISLSNPDDSLPLDIWLEDSVPPQYRIATILQDKMVTDEVVITYHAILERISHDHAEDHQSEMEAKDIRVEDDLPEDSKAS